MLVRGLVDGALLDAFGYAGGAVIFVSSARSAVLKLWPSYRAAWRFSNTQALTELDGFDLLWVSALPGISEELLFRGLVVIQLNMYVVSCLFPQYLPLCES